MDSDINILSEERKRKIWNYGLQAILTIIFLGFSYLEQLLQLQTWETKSLVVIIPSLCLFDFIFRYRQKTTKEKISHALVLSAMIGLSFCLFFDYETIVIEPQDASILVAVECFLGWLSLSSTAALLELPTG